MLEPRLAAPPEPPSEPPTDAISVLFVLMPHSLVLDWAGPAEALRLANQTRARAGLPPRFVLRFVGPQAQCATSVGAFVTGIEPLPSSLPSPSWLVLVGSPDEAFNLQSDASRALVHGLQRLSGALVPPNRLLTICAGALLAAQAGLLFGRRVTTHHLELDKLRALEPGCEVLANRVFVTDDGADGVVFSSAGITTGIDLAIHLIAQECGEAVAARVAQTMVMPLRRGTEDPELSPFLAYRHHLHAGVHRVQDAVSADPTAGWSVPRMAELANTSPRHLARLFLEHGGIAPLQYLRRIRLCTAEQALRSGLSVAQAAQRSGLGSATQLRRAWADFGRPATPRSAR